MSNGDCLEDKMEDYQKYSVLYGVLQLWYAHAYEQFSQLAVGLGLGSAVYMFSSVLTKAISFLC